MTPPISSRTPAEAYSAILRERRVSHGAFRLWHCLANHLNRKTGLCCPGQRKIAAEIGCDIHSLKGWTDELKESGWLAVNELNRGFTYVLLDGESAPLWKPTTTVVETHNSDRCGNPQTTVAENHNGSCGKPSTQLNKGNNSGGTPPQFEPVKPGLYRREYEAMIEDAHAEIKRIKGKEINWIRDLTDSAAELIRKLEAEKPKNWEERLRLVNDAASSHERTVLRDDAADCVEVWKARIDEIRKVMAGRID